MNKKFKIILSIILLIIVGLGSALFLFINSPQFKTQMAQIVSSNVQSILGNRINIDSLEIISPTSAAVDNVELYDKNDELIVKADKMVFTVNLWEAIANSPLAGLSQIDIEHPDANIERRNDGSWNFEDLLDSQSPTSGDFKGNVKISDGAVTLRLDGKQISVDKVNMTADCADLKAVKIDGSLAHNDAQVEFSGTVGSNENTNLDVNAENLEILDYISLIPEEQLANVNIKSGHVNRASINVSSDFKDGYELNGSIDFQDGACEVQGYDVSNINGLILLDGQDLQLFVKGDIAEQTVAVHGKVKDYMSSPRLFLIAESRKFAPAALIDGAPVDGDTSFIAAIYGTPDDLKIGAEVKSNSLSVYGYEINNLTVKARYAQNQLFVDDLEADFTNGWIWASGQCNLDDLSYKGSFKLNNIDLSVFNNYVPDITGTGVIRGDFKGTGTDFANLNLSGRMEVTNGSYQNIPIEKVEASFYKDGNSLQVDAMTASFANGGRLAAKGGMIDNRLDINFYASGVDMTLAQNYAPEVALSGTANFSGHLYGNPDNPVLQIEGMAQDGSIMHQPFDSLLVSAIGNLDGMRVDKAQFINNGEITHDATGILGFKGKKVIDMVVKTKQARMENLMQAVMPDLKLTGNVDNTLHLTGSLEELKVTGQMHFYEGSFNGILLNEVNGTYEYNDGDIYLHGFDIDSPFLKAKLDGTIDKNQEMNFKFSAKEILLEKMQVEWPYPVSGKASFDGTLSGKIGGLNFDGILQADDIMLNGQQVDDVYGRLMLQNRVITLNQFTFKQKDGDFALNGSMNLNTKEIQGEADIMQADVNSAMAIMNLQNRMLNGNFNGHANIYGTYEHPKVDVKGEMPTGTLKDYPLQNIQVEAQLDNTTVKINHFYGEQGNGKIAAQGSVDLAGGPLEGRISVSNMDVNLLTNLCDLGFKIDGVMNGDVQFGGTLDSPNADITLSAQGDGKDFDTAYVLANLKDNIIYINQAAGTKGNCAIKAEGTIPLAALSSDKRDEASMQDQMNMKLYLENTDLSILPTFTPYVDWAMGNVQGTLNITGTVAKPDFKGNISTKDSAIKFTFMDSPMQNMNVDIDFNKNLMTVKQFNGMIGNGSYDLQGSANITGQGVSNYNFNLALNHLDIVSDYYTGPLNGSMQINEVDMFGRKIPKLTTNLDFNDITVSMPPLPETSDEPWPMAALDINVNLGDNVHIYDPQLYDLYLQGGFKIKGTTRHPDSSGTLTARNGTINVLKTIFKIQEGTVTFNQVDSMFPSIDFLAVTRLDRTKVFVTLKGPVDKELTPKLFSDPPMNDAEIIKLLAFRTEYKDGDSGEITESDLVSFATLGLQMSFLNELEGTLRNVLDLDEFRISRDTLSDSDRRRFDIDTGEVYNIEIGKYLSDKVMLRYTKGINYDLNKVGLQYYINNNLGVTTEFYDDGAYNLKMELQWKF